VTLGLDTSVLIRLLVGEPASLATKAQERLLEAHRVRQAVIVSDLVIAETYYALKYHYDLEPNDIRQALFAMLTSGMVQPEPGSAVLSVIQDKKPGKAGFVDRLIQAHYESDGITTLTLDKAQSKMSRTEFIG
jgi:predicted nucleic-acid-binding protein